jgi:hypothetical protein
MLRSPLATPSNGDLVGEATTGREAGISGHPRPDVVPGLWMPGLHGRAPTAESARDAARAITGHLTRGRRSRHGKAGAVALGDGHGL